MSINQIAVGKLALALCGIFTVLMPPKTASADHCSYVYTGATVGFHGEARMIAALQYMEIGYLSHDRRSEYFHHAEDQIRLARYEVSSPAARKYLRGADRYLDGFRWNGDSRQLDEAARLVGIALQVERSTIHHAAHPVSPYAVARPLVPQTQQIYSVPRRQVRGTNLSIYGNWGHLGVRF